MIAITIPGITAASAAARKRRRAIDMLVAKLNIDGMPLPGFKCNAINVRTYKTTVNTSGQTFPTCYRRG